MPVELTRSRKLANLATAIDSASSGSILKKGTEQGEYVSVSLSEVSGVPTFLDSSSATTIIDSSYIQARQSGGGGTAFDSSTLTSLVDSNYITSRFSNGNSGFKLYRYNATAGQTTFQDSDRKGNILSYTVGGVKVFYNGVSLLDTEFTADDGSSVVLDSAASLNAKIQIAKWNVPSSGGGGGSSFSWGGDRGLFGGGHSPSAGHARHNVIQYVDITTPGNATDFGDLSNSVAYPGAVSDTTYGVWAGGTAPSAINVIDYITIATTGNASDFGDLTAAKTYISGNGDGTYGLFGGGVVSGAQSNTIDYITIATTGNSSDFGDLTQARYHAGAAGDATRGIYIGGWLDLDPYQSNTIDYVTYATPGNATDFGDTGSANTRFSACSDLTYTVFAYNGGTNTIEYVTTQTTGNATDFGDWITTRDYLATSSNGTYGVWGGGTGTDVTATNNGIEYITIATPGNASDFGNLSVTFYGGAGCSGSPS